MYVLWLLLGVTGEVRKSYQALISCKKLCIYWFWPRVNILIYFTRPFHLAFKVVSMWLTFSSECIIFDESAFWSREAAFPHPSLRSDINQCFTHVSNVALYVWPEMAVSTSENWIGISILIWDKMPLRSRANHQNQSALNRARLAILQFQEWSWLRFFGSREFLRLSVVGKKFSALAADLDFSRPPQLRAHLDN